VNGAIVKALNRAIDTGYTYGGRKVRERYNIQASSIAQRTTKVKAMRGGASLSASLKANTRTVSLKQFAARHASTSVLESHPAHRLVAYRSSCTPYLTVI